MKKFLKGFFCAYSLLFLGWLALMIMSPTLNPIKDIDYDEDNCDYF